MFANFARGHFPSYNIAVEKAKVSLAFWKFVQSILIWWVVHKLRRQNLDVLKASQNSSRQTTTNLPWLHVILCMTPFLVIQLKQDGLLFLLYNSNFCYSTQTRQPSASRNPEHSPSSLAFFSSWVSWPLKKNRVTRLSKLFSYYKLNKSGHTLYLCTMARILSFSSGHTRTRRFLALAHLQKSDQFPYKFY